MSTQNIIRLYTAVHWMDRLIDRASESGVAKLSAVSLALFGLSFAVGIATFSGRYADAASFEFAFLILNQFVWAGLYAVVSGLLLFAALTERSFTPGALLGLAAVHTALGLTTIPAFLFGDGLPGGFIQYAGNSVWCFITYLLWRVRVRGRR